MMKKKKDGVSTILASSTAPQSVAFDTSDLIGFCIALTYGAGSSTTAKLQSSLDGTTYVDYPGSSVTLDNAGGAEMWSLSDYRPLYCKLVITGDAITCVAKLAQEV